MSKQLFLVLNGKGGVGKSFFAVNLVQYLKDRGIAHVAIDTDNENSTLKRFHAESLYIRIDREREIDRLFSALDDSDLIVADCRAASTDIFLRYFSAVELFEVLARWPATLTIISPINHEMDSVEQVRLLSEKLGKQCAYLIVKNQSHSEQFEIYDQSRTRTRVLGELKGREVVMPRMADWLVTTLNKNNLTITPALSVEDIPFFDRQRMRIWQRRFYEELDGTLSFSTPKPTNSARK
jgi:tRNA uridine 5-carbamoylmethylation protein Kti12